ncbi:MAG TPA: hypothetical protein VFG22_15145 [Polyangiales bacterium]|nr:hypothetical protein [Polyangiales bacterium]
MNLLQALESLDPLNSEQWTMQGLPRIEAVSEIMGREVTRMDITNTAPRLVRENARPKAQPATVDTEGNVIGESADAPERVEIEDPKMTAHVGPHDDVVGMPAAQVYGSAELIDRALDEFSRQSDILTARREAIAEKIKELSKRTELLTRARNTLARAGKIKDTATPISDYLKSQQHARAMRAERARRFIDAGTTERDVILGMKGVSPLDAAIAAKNTKAKAPQPLRVSMGQG